MTYAFAAAGTGGHVYPALAVADELVERGVSRDEIVFFGGDRMEATTVPNAGFRFVSVDIHGLDRSLSRRNLSLPRKVQRATRRIRDELAGAATRVMAVFGGYVSVPAARAARAHGATVYLHEQNAAPGLANRIITRWAETSFVAFPAAAHRLRHAHLVGNPVRPSLITLEKDALRTEALKRYDVPDDRTVLGVLGGSLGALVLNQITERIASMVDPDRIAIVHLTGPSHIDTVESAAAAHDVVWRPVAFEREMEHFYAASDLVLSRAGALTISELAVTATPAVVVPLAATKQSANAAYLAEVGGAVLIEQVDIERVPGEVLRLLGDPKQRSAMAATAATRALPDAAAVMADRMMEAVS